MKLQDYSKYQMQRQIEDMKYMEMEKRNVIKRRKTNDPYRSKIEHYNREKRRTVNVLPWESLMDNFVVGSKIKPQYLDEPVGELQKNAGTGTSIQHILVPNYVSDY